MRVPTLIIHGRHDDVVDIDLSRQWTHGKPHVRLVEVDDGHELVASIDRIIAESDAFLSGFLRAGPRGQEGYTFSRSRAYDRRGEGPGSLGSRATPKLLRLFGYRRRNLLGG